MADKNKYGQYFTVRPIADFMVSLISHGKDCKILEPSCGKGVFLDGLVDSGFTDVAAYEIDATLGANYDFVQFRSFLSVPTTEKYDVIIGNPPYIRWKNLEQELKEELKDNPLWNKYFNSLCDYLFIFILKSIEHLNDNGELLFICSEYWMNTTHSATLRNYMCREGYISEIYHFKEAALFEKVTASFIIFKFIKSFGHKKKDIKFFSYNKEKGVPALKELMDKTCFDEVLIPQFNENTRWILAPFEEQNKLRAFEKACLKRGETLFDEDLYRIGDFCDIGNGMVSGLDAAFQILENEELNDKEQAALITVLKAKNLGAYKNKASVKYVFLQEAISEEAFERVYPHFAAHFKPFIDRLNLRYSYNRKIPYWEFVFPRNQKLFERKEPRIFVPCKERISNKSYFRFCYAAENCFPTQDVTAVFTKKNCKESLEYILAYLNNPRVFDWLKFNGVVKGAIVEFSEAPIASIPFRPIDWKSVGEVELHERITAEVRSFLIDEKQAHIVSINQYFNQLFHERS